MAWRLWGRGLIAAIIGGAVSSLSVWTIDPADFNFDTGIVKLAKVAFVSALMNAAVYLKQHPIPEAEYVKPATVTRIREARSRPGGTGSKT
jgi:hypothetical protein